MKMYAYVREYVNKLVTPNRTEYVATLKSQNPISADDIIQEAAAHAKMEEDDIRKAINAVGKSAALFMGAGHSVQIPNIGTLMPQLRAKAVTDPTLCTRDTFKGEGVNFTLRPTGKLAIAIKEMTVTLLKWGQTEADTDDQTSDQTGDQTANQNPGTNPGNQQTNPGTNPTGQVTLVFRDHNGQEVKTMQVAVGATILQSDIPAASSSSYRYPFINEVNSRLATATAGQTLTFTEVENDDSF